MMDVDRRNEIIARRGAPATEAELQAVSAWLVDYFSRRHHGGDLDRAAEMLGMTRDDFGARLAELMRTEP